MSSRFLKSIEESIVRWSQIPIDASYHLPRTTVNHHGALSQAHVLYQQIASQPSLWEEYHEDRGTYQYRVLDVSFWDVLGAMARREQDDAQVLA